MYMGKCKFTPDYVLESSWEVCNKVGGIYTVLSSRAKTLQSAMRDKIIFIGPDFGGDVQSEYFSEDPSLYAQWQDAAAKAGIKARIGRWNVPGNPVTILVDFKPYFEVKNRLYGWLWEHYGVDSLHAYGDYDEEHVIDLPKEIFLIDGKFDSEHIVEGAVIPLMTSDGHRVNGSVVEVKDKVVVMDMNHPLAGCALNFVGQVVTNRPATNQELADAARMMSGGCGGCGGCGGDNDCDCESGCGGCCH